MFGVVIKTNSLETLRHSEINLFCITSLPTCSMVALLCTISKLLFLNFMCLPSPTWKEKFLNFFLREPKFWLERHVKCLWLLNFFKNKFSDSISSGEPPTSRILWFFLTLTALSKIRKILIRLDRRIFWKKFSKRKVFFQ